MTPLTTFSGIASGIDSATLISSLVKSAKTPITRLQTKQAANSSISGKFTDIKTKLTALQDAAKDLDTAKEVKVSKVTSSDEAFVKAATSGGANAANFTVTVTSLARTERTYSDAIGASDQSGLFGTGVLSIQVGSDDAVDVEVNSDDTLEDIAGRINDSGARVSASIVFDGSSYRLQVSGTDSGAANAISFSETAQLALGLSTPANQFQAATDAVFTVDDITVTSATNVVTSAIPGVTLTLSGEGSSEISIERDPEGLQEKLQGFVDAYNDVMKQMNAEFSYSGTRKPADSLSGDSMLRSVQSSLRRVMSQSLAGSGSVTSIGSMGIQMQNDGTLSIDATKLSTAVAEDFSGVVAALSSSDGAQGLMLQVVSSVEELVSADGSIATRISSLATRNKQLDTQIEGMQLRIDKYEEQLRAQFTALESLMGGMQTQSNALNALIQSMSGSNQ